CFPTKGGSGLTDRDGAGLKWACKGLPRPSRGYDSASSAGGTGLIPGWGRFHMRAMQPRKKRDLK
ncbi:hypothetical protein D4Z77_08795, partial [Campylobacter coli]